MSPQPPAVHSMQRARLKSRSRGCDRGIGFQPVNLTTIGWKPMPTHPSHAFHGQRPSRPKPSPGFALVLVLAFVVLLSGVCLAFFSNALLQRQVSNSSATRVDVDLLAQGAVDTVIADLKQEIAAGSDPAFDVFADGSRLYKIVDNAKMVPERVGFAKANGGPNSDHPNLLKISEDVNFSTGGTPSKRASPFSTLTPSADGRFISTARWNKPLLMTPTATDDDEPEKDFQPPNWILISSDPASPNPKTPDDNVIGRYAYAIYEVGGLLDINVAGYPGKIADLSNTTIKNDLKRKMGLPSVDLRELMKDDDTPAFPETADIDKLITWRNFASAPKIARVATDEKPAAFAEYVRRSGGFAGPKFGGLESGRSDSIFIGRQQLIDFVREQLTPGSQSALPYLTTFSRDLDQPSVVTVFEGETDPRPANRPKILPKDNGGNQQVGKDKEINPSFLDVRVASTVSGGRNDDSDLIAGEPLVKKRFALDRLAWLTKDGPSADAPAETKEKLRKAGFTDAFIAEGFPDNIEKYFGLTWDKLPAAASEEGGENGWLYRIHDGDATNPIKTLEQVKADNREPNFFELLKAAIHVGSLGKAAAISDTAGTNDAYFDEQIPINYYYTQNSSVDNHVMQIGANIVDQFDSDSFPFRLVYANDSSRVSGIEDLPYLTAVYNGVIRTSAVIYGTPGRGPNSPGSESYPQANNHPEEPDAKAVLLQLPSLWNPHDVRGNRGDSRPVNFRVIAESVDPYNRNFGQPITVTASAEPGGTKFSETGKVFKDDDISLEFVESTGDSFREPVILFMPEGEIAFQSPKTFQPFFNDQPICRSLLTYTGLFTGLVLGESRLSWKRAGSSETSWGQEMRIYPQGKPEEPAYLLYKVQYKDDGKWITYDKKYGRAIDSGMHTRWAKDSDEGSGSTLFYTGNGTTRTLYASAIDPRTSRFGMFVHDTDRFHVFSPAFVNNTESNQAPNETGRFTPWIDPENGINISPRPAAPNYYFVSQRDSTADIFFPKTEEGWAESFYGTWPAFPLGMLSENRSGATFSVPRISSGAKVVVSGASYYADPDGIVRRAAGGFVSTANTTTGLPEATTASYPEMPPGIDVGNPENEFHQSQSRPLMLNRPFRSVSELGYVFRDLPWKNLDFSSPESGDAALLDVFSIAESRNENGLIAGKINLNTAHPNTLAAIVSSASIDDPRADENTVGSLSQGMAGEITDAWNKRVTAPFDEQTGAGPIANLSELTGRWTGLKAPITPLGGGSATGQLTDPIFGSEESYVGFASRTSSVAGSKSLIEIFEDASNQKLADGLVNIQRFREAPIRALAGAGQTRVWNVMVDLITQTGRYIEGTAGDDVFAVSGEQRLWVHLAIDRLTGKILEKQIEVISE